VVSRGTGSSIRTRFGIRGDVAGKTGTTQGNADGWFILISPQLVAGSWVGFNDSRVTLRSDYWGQGAHSALPIVGDFFQRAQRAKLVDSRVRFATDQEPGWFAERSGRLREWFEHLIEASPVKTQAPVVTRNTTRHAPAAVTATGAAAPASVASTAAASAAAADVEPRALPPQPPLLQAPASASVPANRAVDGEAHGSGEPALAPTPTPDDVGPPEAGGAATQIMSAPASASASP
jgi:penicillin-binding protein 1A